MRTMSDLQPLAGPAEKAPGFANGKWQIERTWGFAIFHLTIKMHFSDTSC